MPARSEPCVACGEETIAGSALFSDRRVIDDGKGAARFVCSSCMQRFARHLRRDRLTDEETRRFIASGSMAIIGNH